MPESVMSSATKKRQGERVQELGVLAKTPQLKRFFSSKTSKQQR